MRMLVIAVSGLALLYLLVLLAAWRWQERVVWQPPATVLEVDRGTRRIDYTSADGQPLYAYLVGDPARARGLVIAFHGNADLAARLVAWGAEVHARTGWAVLLPEYRGYGGLSGTPDYPASHRDALAAYRVARETLVVDASRIAIHGHSLGSAVATELAADHPPAVLVLVSPFTSAREMAGAFRPFPISPMWGLIGRVKFDTKEKVASLPSAVWVAHGERDMIIPVRMGRAVHAAARSKGELLLVRGAGHNDVELAGGDAYWSWLQRALGAADVSPAGSGAS
jgi:uncharacterized protein